MDFFMKDNIKVIYVEDEPSIARLLSSGLGLFGITVNPIFMSAEELLSDVDGEDFNSADIRLSYVIGLGSTTFPYFSASDRKRHDFMKKHNVLILAFSIFAFPRRPNASICELLGCLRFFRP